MSHDATAWAKAQKTGHGTAKLILLLLADYAGTDYSCYPSVAKLAELSELAESTVRSVTKLLAEKGLIRVFYRYRDNHTRRSSRYQLLVDGPETAEPDAEDWAHHRQVPAESHRQEPEGTRQELADSHRQETAVIPYKEPSLKEPSPVIPGASQPKTTATRVPEDFLPTDALRAWYAAEKLEQVIDGRIEHEKFMDYWRAVPGAKGKKQDWPATWRNWMRTAAERAGRRPGTGLAPTSGAPYRPSTTDQKVAQTLELGRRLQAMEDAK